MADAIELGSGWGVTLGETQWTLERWRSPSWRPRSYCCTRDALVRCIIEHCGAVNLTQVLALPEWHPDREPIRGLSTLQTRSEAVGDAKEIVSRLKQLRFVGRISAHDLTLLVPRGIALDELNLHRAVRLTDAELVRALRDQHVEDYPQRASSLSAGLTPYVYPERALDPRIGSNPDGSTPGALQGDDYPLTYDADGNVELPACLDRRKPKLAARAAA
jgi:hypothetical protein